MVVECPSVRECQAKQPASLQCQRVECVDPYLRAPVHLSGKVLEHRCNLAGAPGSLSSLYLVGVTRGFIQCRPVFIFCGIHSILGAFSTVSFVKVIYRSVQCLVIGFCVVLIRLSLPTSACVYVFFAPSALHTHTH